ncbi:hypothetical protein KUCAC02_014850 [Chaenocephalus aceratus]|uniref:Uncharacterized protein n=1 Tax=Chaenocephalus aceratus TaxID=36190 RepID=A0ACB9WGM0_CHAAC|nr:hypothetical protein KUCAC02_014850 [Chaenocephalus aceratus]
MSFKREGDDKSQLNILKKRRVADLLSNYIPEDEAALMNNGRYTCLVCSYRPVFDTVDTLTVHRNGKKHLEGLKGFYGKKETLLFSSSIGQTRKLTHHALLKTVPYNSCHTKTSTKGGKGALRAQQRLKREKPAGKLKFQNRSSQSASSGCTAANEDTRPDVKGAESAEPQEAEPITAERKRELEHYLKLKSDGWLRDRSGQWVRDGNVEFDSDEEEEAPSLSPLPTSP